ncbi:lipopolysaccharide biosynthesis protein [Flavilitoribacter nigricans]|uniref:lipopolysaccharide biosynthesis protein n=1 Tax=Flavilitoribacter nigricans TaxID=70997 RepID=UPI001C9E8066|nr:lipopolysaccharide biosynthesis protein [Flavilitoribacter nigricans]
MSEGLKEKTSRGLFWNALEKFSVQLVKLIVGIVLARLLFPEDFGLIGMLSIFIAISQIFVNSGMGSGLIQKKVRTDLDYSTVFLFNLVVSIFFYLVLLFSAPLIAKFYDKIELILLTRVLGLNIVISAFAMVQRAKLIVNIDFKTLARVNLIASVLSGIAAIVLAILGWGVWALVMYTLLNTLVSVFLLWKVNKWIPSMEFSRESFNELFGFSSKILLSRIYEKVSINIYNIIIGKYYSAAALGFYTRAKSLAEIPSGTLSNVLQQVSFPVFSSLQDERVRLVSAYSRMVRMAAFIIIPIMILVSILAEPIVRILLTEKWIEVVPLLQWTSIAYVIYPISVINMNILNAMGRSDLFLKVDLSKFPLTVVSLIVTVPFGIKAIVIGHVVTSFISFFINAYLPGKILGYGPLSQLKDIMPMVLSAIIMSIAVITIVNFVSNDFFQIVLGCIVAIVTYLSLSKMFNIKEMSELEEFVGNLKYKFTS